MRTASKILLLLAALLLLVGVQLGALGAHALEDRLTPRQIDNWQLAVQYQLVHGLGIILITLLREKLLPSVLLGWSAWIMLGGIFMFCGSIYAGSLGAPAAAGQIAPVGGVSFMVGWLLVAITTIRNKAL